MGEQQIYCNVTECFFNQPLEEPHTKKGRPGFSAIGGTDQYRGFCGNSGIEMRYEVFRSPTDMKQKVAYCSSFFTEYSNANDYVVVEPNHLNARYLIAHTILLSAGGRMVNAAS